MQRVHAHRAARIDLGRLRFDELDDVLDHVGVLDMMVGDPRQEDHMLAVAAAGDADVGFAKTPMSLSVLGCVVNGPGEARETDIGITGGGNGKHMVYLSGVTDHHVEDADMIAHIVKLVEAKAAAIDAGSAVSMDVTHGKAA